MKRKIKYKSNIFLSIIFSLFCIFVFPNIIISQDLFQDVPQSQLSKKQLEIYNKLLNLPSTKDIKIAKFDISLFETSSSINLNISQEKNFLTVKKNLKKRGALDFTWFANIPGKYSDIVFSVYKDALMGYMVIDNDCYNLRALGNELICIVHADPSKYLPDKFVFDFENKDKINVSPEENNNALTNNYSLSTSAVVQKSLTTNYTIRVLVAYTEDALDEVGSVNNMNSLIDNCIETANETFDNSNIDIELEIAHRRLVYDYNESSQTESYDNYWDCVYSFDETHLKTLFDFQESDSIHVLRNAYAADICVLITSTDIGLGGEAYDIKVPENIAYCVVNHYDADAGEKWSFTHEIGHLLGGRHQYGASYRRGDDNCNVPNQNAHGYQFIGDDNGWYRTMMSTEDTYEHRIKYFSNPEIEFEGHATGESTYCNVASVINGYASTAAQFRENYEITDNVVLTEDLVIESEKTLTISEGVTIYFNPGVKLIINGTLNAIGSVSAPITFDKKSTSNWYGIKINSSSASSSVIQYATIKNADFGVMIYGASPTMSDTKINICGYGIYINGGAPLFFRNTITYNDYSGVRCLSSAEPSFGTDPDYGDNVIRRNDDYGIYSAYYCDIFLGIATSPPIGGRNSIYENYASNGYQVYLTRGSTSMAEANWWGSDPPSTSIFNNPSVIDYNPWWPNSDPHSSRPLTKVLAEGGSQQSSSGNIDIVNDSFELSDKFWEAFCLLHKSEYDKAIQLCEDIISVKPSSQEAMSALNVHRLAYIASRKQGYEKYITDIITKYSGKEISGVARINYAWYYVDKNKIEKALQQLQKNIDDFPNSSLERISIFQKGMHNLFNLNDKNAAEACFNELSNKYPDDDLNIDAQGLEGSFEKSELGKSSSVTTKSFDFLFQNYPNPFNPVTTIIYQIPYEAHVSVLIYNLQGQVVARLVDEQQSEGNHSVQWNAVCLPSGVYFCKMKTGEFSSIRKIMLLK